MKQLIAAAFVFAAFFIASSSASAQGEPPAGWTCNPAFFGSDDGCDCGCGAPDTDCADATRASCAFNQCMDAATQVPSAGDPSTCVANTCGDGYRGGTEVCDDGGTTGCSADCAMAETGFACGGNAAGCHAIVCGDGIVEFPGEACDDNNAAAGDGCSTTCTVEDGFVCGFDGTCHAVVCGDSIVDFGEETCDDGNGAAGDGCDAACAEEEGFSCGAAGEACVAVPAAWVCQASFFGGADGCDCGCGALDPDCDGGGCAESGCNDNDVCAFCYTDGESTGCEGEGEGEGEGDAGEGEGEGAAEGEGEGDGLSDDPDVDAGAGCAATGADTSAAALALFGVTFLIARRRRT